LGVDINTPTGLQTSKSMVRLVNHELPPWLKPFRTKGSIVNAEAVFCDLGEGKALIVLIAFKKGGPSNRQILSKLPWLVAKYPRDEQHNWPRFIEGRIEIQKELTPTIIAFEDINNPQSARRIFIGNKINFSGETYSVNNIWIEMTKDFYNNLPLQSKIPWWDFNTNQLKHGYENPLITVAPNISLSSPLKRTQ